MKRLLLAVLLTLGCAHTETAEPHDTTPTPPAALPGNAAVQARLAALPDPPRPWSEVAASLDADDFVALCPYVEAHVPLDAGEVTCPDGSTVTIHAHPCDPQVLAATAHSLPCAISWGEIVACRIAYVENPCRHVEECAAYDACTLIPAESSTEGGTP